jgi:hypothetical protein
MSAQTLDLPMPTVEYMIDAVFDAVSANARRSREAVQNERDFAAAALVALQPADAIEASLAVRIVAAHHSAMDNLRRAAMPDIEDVIAIRLRANANALSRMAERLTATLEARQAMSRAARQALAQEAALSAPRGPEPTSEENCEQDPIHQENAAPPPSTNPPPKPYRIRLEQQRADKQAARAARIGDLQDAGGVAMMAG